MEEVMKILVVDDEDRIRRLLNMYLSREGFEIEEASNGEEGLKKAINGQFDCVLLDVMMPEKDGLEVLKELRDKEFETPIIMLTAKGEETDRLSGFEIGADDYIVKPFSVREVVLRVKALLRRSDSQSKSDVNATNKNIVVLTDLIIDHDAHRVTAEGRDVKLTPKEYELLYFLAKSPDKVYEREQLLKEVWHYEFFGDLRTVDTHVKRLREKLGSVSENAAKMIVTVWGVGYKLKVSND
ncbi:response regulator transcription factor [Sporosarcina ureae]|uniref:response regulator transcription factor n=1 Tax=Sporosarcina ureae TaxID=1571 RepID=UPI0026F006A9|nr:response regulator transcription factor [Sporosarcina ureae]